MARSPLAEVARWASEPPRPVTTVDRNGAGFNLESFIASHLDVRRGPLPWEGRGRKWELETCPFNPEHTNGCAVVTEGSNGAIGFKCHHDTCSDKHWRDLRDLFEEPRSESKSAASVVPADDSIPLITTYRSYAAYGAWKRHLNGA